MIGTERQLENEEIWVNIALHLLYTLSNVNVPYLAFLRNTLSIVSVPNPPFPHKELSNVYFLNPASPHNTLSNVNFPKPTSQHKTLSSVRFPILHSHTTHLVIINCSKHSNTTRCVLSTPKAYIQIQNIVQCKLPKPCIPIRHIV